MDIRRVKKLINLMIDSDVSEIEFTDKDGSVRISRDLSPVRVKQEPIGAEFEKVLNENLSDLYGS